MHAVSHPEQSSLSSSRLRIGNFRVVVAALTTALLVISGLSLPSPAAADDVVEAAVVSGRIVDSDGAAVAGERVAVIRVAQDYYGTMHTQEAGWALSGEDGRYAISMTMAPKAGDYFHLRVSTVFASPFLWKTDGPLFAIRGAETSADMTVVRSASISGTVTDAIGLPAYGQVSVFRISEKGSTWTRTADIRAGRLAIDKAEPGEYRLRFQIPGQPDTWWPGSAVESEAESIVLNEGDRRSLVVTSAAAVTISGTVVTTEGLLIPGPGSYPARVYAHRLVGDRFEQAGFASLDDAGGYRLNVLPGRYALEFEGISGFAREFTGDASLLSEAQTFEAAPGAPVVRDAVLGLGGSIAGSATWADEVVAIDADGRVAGTAELDYVGAPSPYRIEGLPPGAYTVRARATDATFYNSITQWWPGSSTPEGAEAIELGSGEARGGVDLVRVAGATLFGVVRVYDDGWMPVGGATVTAVAADGRALATTTAGELGRFELYQVLPGEIRLRIDSTDGREWYWPAADSFETAGILTAEPGRLIRDILTGPQATVSVPVITGTPAVGEILRVSATSPIPGVEITYRWRGGFVPEHVGPTLVVTPEMADARIAVTATASRPGYTSMTSDSGWTLSVLKWGKPWFDDSDPAVGVPQFIADARWNTSYSTTTARQWYADGVLIPGATGQRYTPTLAEEGKRLTVKTTGSAPGYADGWAVSDPSLRVIRSGTPTISGVARVGSVLKVDLGDWTDGAAVNWEWLLDDEWVVGYSQHDAEFTVPPEAVGKRISVVAWGEKTGYGRVFVKSAQTARAIAAREPVVTGTPFVGSTLTAEPGDWGPGVPLEFQWYANGAAIAGATSKQYEPVSSQVGKQLAVRVIVDEQGWAAGSKTSAATARVALAPVPSVSGSVRVGGELTVVPGTWVTGTVLAYQWYSNGSVISGATSTSFLLPPSLAGTQLTVRVTGRLSGYPTVTRSSAATPKVLAWAVPTVSGTTRVGNIVTANPGNWSAGTSFSYQWYANGAPIARATSKTFVPSSAQVGKRLSVRVTGGQSGFGSMAATSSPTVKPVALPPAPPPGSVSVDGKPTQTTGTWNQGMPSTSRSSVDGDGTLLPEVPTTSGDRSAPTTDPGGSDESAAVPTPETGG